MSISILHSDRRHDIAQELAALDRSLHVGMLSAAEHSKRLTLLLSQAGRARVVTKATRSAA